MVYKIKFATLDISGLIITYAVVEDAVYIANAIALEHLELQVMKPDIWILRLRNYDSLFIGSLAAEVLGYYSAGINHILPKKEAPVSPAAFPCAASSKLSPRFAAPLTLLMMTHSAPPKLSHRPRESRSLREAPS